jgi:hypothetical protein
MMIRLSFLSTARKSLRNACWIAAAGAVLSIFPTGEATACHSSYPDWRKIADPAGYLFCSEVFAHFDSSGLGPEISEAERRHGHPCHLDCRPPGDGLLMGHMHGITLPDGGCNIEVVHACQLRALPEAGNREVPGMRRNPEVPVPGVLQDLRNKQRELIRPSPNDEAK